MASDGNDRDIAVSVDSAADAGPAEPIPVAMSFVDAIVWGEHLRVWELLSSDAKGVVLSVAVGRGMDEGLSARLQAGTAAVGERDTFLSDPVNGFRTDLRGNDIDALDYQQDHGEGEPDPNHARVLVVVPVNQLLGSPLPVAAVELVREGRTWKVDHLQRQAKS